MPCRFRLCFVRRRRVPGHGHHPGPAAGDVGRRCLPYACQAALHDRPRRAGQGRPRGVDAACRGRILPRLLCRGLRRRHARARTASYGRRRPRKLPSRRLPHKDHAHGPRCRRVVLRTPVARTTGRAPRPPHSGRHDRGRPALRLPGLHARRLAPFPRQGVRRTSARPHGALQAQPLPLAPDRRSRMAHRNQKIPRPDRHRRLASLSRLGGMELRRQTLLPPRRPGGGRGLLHAGRHPRSGRIRPCPAYRGDSRDRDAGAQRGGAGRLPRTLVQRQTLHELRFLHRQRADVRIP